MFDKGTFANLISKAQGSKSLNEFAQSVNISPAHISRLKRSMLDVPPNPDVIKKLSNNDTIAYEEFMIAAGHIEEPIEEDKLFMLKYKSLSVDQRRIINELIEQFK